MKNLRRWVSIVGLTGVLAMALPVSPAAARGDFNDEYVYPTTRAVSQMRAHPGWKMTLYPVTLAVDTAFLPFGVIAGFITA
jgi:hypothetical protein